MTIHANSPSLTGLSPKEKRELLAKLLRQQSAETESVYPLSEGQRGLWYLSENDPTHTACHLSLPLRIRSPLDFDAFRQTFQMIVDRHPCLRTTIENRDGRLVQRVHSNLPMSLEFVDAAGMSDDALHQRLEDEAHRPFDLQRGPLLRLYLFTRRPDDHVFLAVVHHIVVDFWSLVVILGEFHICYAALQEGRDVALPPLRMTYRDFVEKQTAMLNGPDGQRLWSAWRDQLSGVPHVLDLPTDRPRPPVFSHRGATVVFRISQSLTTRLKALADAEEVTLFTALMAGFQLLLSRYAQQDEFVVGSPFSGRGHAGCEEIVGYFINMLPLRVNLAGNPTFRELLHQVRETVFHALQYENFPFSRLVERLSVRRDPSRSPLVQATFTLEKSHRGDESQGERFLLSQGPAQRGAGNFVVEPYHVEQRTCQGDLELLVQGFEGELEGTLRYNRDLFDAETIERMAERFQSLLEHAAAEPQRLISELRWFPDSERRQVVVEWNRTHVDFPGEICLHHLFEQQVARTPKAVAVSGFGRQLTYSELDVAANRLAYRLARQGVCSEQRVALIADRSMEMVIGILAILKAGGAYVPLDPASPPERLQRILDDAEPSVILAQKSYVDLHYPKNVPVVVLDDWAQELGDEFGSPPETNVAANHLAYVIYTSGSTGQPKGVMVEHRAICNTIQWRNRELPIHADDRVLLTVPHFFDASLCIIFPTLTSGGRLLLADPGDELQPSLLWEFVAREQATVLAFPPGLLRMMADSPEFADACRSVRWMLTGGESMATDVAKRIHDKFGAPFYNMYGPTETAVEATHWRFEPNANRPNLPIGRPIANVQVYVLDGSLQPMPIGVPGELYIGGAGVARGYLNDPELTSRRFVSDPFSEELNARMFQTGDRCRWLPDGMLEFLGRVDHQVKVRGYRTEIGEIESALASHDAVREVAVAAVADHAGETQLVAYIASDDDDSVADDRMRRFLKTKLPEYMIPVRFERLTQLPRTSTGKLDRSALPAAIPGTSQRGRSFVAPRTLLEEFLADVWRDMLQIDRVGVEDNFFELGGNSIQTTMVVSRIKEKVGQHLHAAALFDSPNIASLARYLEDAFPETIAEQFGQTTPQADDASPAAPQPKRADLLVPLQPRGDRPPLFMVHPPGGIVVCYQPLAYHLGNDQPMYAIRARGVLREEELPDRLEDMAADYVAEIRKVQPTGPYHLGGWSLGGVIALEMAQQILAHGNEMGLLVFLDTTIPFGKANEMYAQEADESGREYGLDLTFEQLTELSADEQLPLLWEHAKKLGAVEGDLPMADAEAILNDLKQLFHRHVQLASDYAVQPYAGRITMIRPTDAPTQIPVAPDRGWRQLADDVEVFYVPGQHHTMVRDPGIKDLAENLRVLLGRF